VLSYLHIQKKISKNNLDNSISEMYKKIKAQNKKIFAPNFTDWLVYKQKIFFHFF